jgi:uncharacterized protein (DUF1330 family)|tara:strand:+ start:163 stop:516 length:354 start_codon:yes stop_codon:yes gene_type:complete
LTYNHLQADPNEQFREVLVMVAYLVLIAEVNDPETYKEYSSRTPPIIKKYGGRFLVRGGEVDTIEGELFNDRLVILVFPSKRAIHDMFSDLEYQAAAEYRKSSSKARILAVDGISEL